MSLEGTLGFLGFGNMGRAILGGLIDTQAIAPVQAAVYDVNPAQHDAATHLGAAVAGSPEALVRHADTIVLAVKPQQAAEALDTLRPAMRPDVLVVSIMAGITTAFIEARLGTGTRVARAMPNTPALVNAGATGLAFNAACTGTDHERAMAIFRAIGRVEAVEEVQLDAVTALSGSGPAYFFYMVECLVQAAVAQGLSETQAARLAAQTLYGAGKLLAESGEPAAVLRQRVTSKGGTTEAALQTFADGGLEGLVQRAVTAAAERSRALSQ